MSCVVVVLAQMDSLTSTVVVTLSANVMCVYICTIVVVGVCIVTCSPCYNSYACGCTCEHMCVCVGVSGWMCL